MPDNDQQSPAVKTKIASRFIDKCLLSYRICEDFLRHYWAVKSYNFSNMMILHIKKFSLQQQSPLLLIPQFHMPKRKNLVIARLDVVSTRRFWCVMRGSFTLLFNAAFIIFFGLALQIYNSSISHWCLLFIATKGLPQCESIVTLSVIFSNLEQKDYR